MNISMTDKDYWKKEWGEGSHPFFEFDEDPYSSFFERFLVFNKSKSVIEIGAYPGRHLGFVSKRFGYKPTAIDSIDDIGFIVENMKRNGIENCEIINEDFLTWEPQEKYDLVLSFGFIEHFVDYISVIEKHIALLKPNGLIFLYVPNFRFIQYLLRRYLLKDVCFKSLCESHNRKIMDLSLLKNILFVKNDLLDIYSGYIHRFGLEINPFGENVNEKRIKHCMFFSKISKIISKINCSNRLYSPSILLVGKKVNNYEIS